MVNSQWLMVIGERGKSFTINHSPLESTFPYRGHRLLQGLELAQHCRDQFGHGGMDVYRPLDHGVGRFGVHHIEDTMDDLVAADAQDRRAQDVMYAMRPFSLTIDN